MLNKDISPENITIGWIGTGIMGAPMCGHILDKGYKTFIYNRTKKKSEDLITRGAVWSDNPSEVASNSDIIFTIVGYPDDVEEVYFGELGIFKRVKPGSVMVDMTTTEPSIAKKIYDKASDLSSTSIDAPVSGGDVGAVNGNLSIMVGGKEEVVNKLMPLFELMGSKIVYQGRAGSGQHAKMCNQIVVAGNMIGICESLIYCYKAGLDPDTMINSVGSGAAASWLLNNLGPRIVKKDYDPGFFVDHFIKDMGIALKESEKMGIQLPGLKLVKSLYEKVSELGHGKLGTQALILALEDISNSGNN